MSASDWLHRLLGHTGAATGNLQRPAGERWGRICPHCKAPSKIRSSQQVTAVYYEQLRVCENPLCGHVWVDGIEAVRTLSPSAVPDAEISIPFSKHIRRDQIVASMSRSGQLDLYEDQK